MFDSAEMDLTSSESYFAILQLLRIAAEWINESMDHLSRLRDDVSKTYSDFLKKTARNSKSEELQLALRLNEKNWGILLTHQRRLGDGLLARIRRKEEEARSLRDAVCNSDLRNLKWRCVITDVLSSSSFSTQRQLERRQSLRS
jgi:hypothetical protein